MTASVSSLFWRKTFPFATLLTDSENPLPLSQGNSKSIPLPSHRIAVTALIPPAVPIYTYAVLPPAGKNVNPAPKLKNTVLIMSSLSAIRSFLIPCIYATPALKRISAILNAAFITVKMLRSNMKTLSSIPAMALTLPPPSWTRSIPSLLLWSARGSRFTIS